MIEYTKTAADTKTRVKEMTWLNGRLFIWIGACALPLSLFFFCVGIFGQAPEAIRTGWQTITLFAVVLAVYLILYVKIRKAVTLNFENNSVDGKIVFTLEKIDESTMEFTRLTDEESFRVTRADIKKIRHGKTISVITLKNGKTIDLPRQPDIEALILFQS